MTWQQAISLTKGKVRTGPSSPNRGSCVAVWTCPEEHMLHPLFVQACLRVYRDGSSLAYLFVVEGPLGEDLTLKKDQAKSGAASWTQLLKQVDL